MFSVLPSMYLWAGEIWWPNGAASHKYKHNDYTNDTGEDNFVHNFNIFPYPGFGFFLYKNEHF